MGGGSSFTSPASSVFPSLISMSMSMLTTEGGRTDGGLGDMEQDAAELAGESEGRSMSPPPPVLVVLKLLMLPSRLPQEMRREALLMGGGGDGMGPSSDATDCCCCCCCCCN